MMAAMPNMLWRGCSLAERLASMRAVRGARFFTDATGEAGATTESGKHQDDHHHHHKLAKGAGMGIGNVRVGLDAIHRIQVQTPAFLAKPKTATIIGAPMTYGQPYAGADRGPQALREKGLHQALIKLGWRIEEAGDVGFEPPGHSAPEYSGPGACNFSYAVGTGCRKLKDLVQKHAAKGNFVLTIGGDHSIAMGSVAGILSVRPNTGVIWVDAHADINSPQTSPTGNMHGMPLGFLTKLVDPTNIPGCEWLKGVPALAPEQLAYVGLRDLDREERNLLKKWNIPAFTMYHVDKFGIGKVMEMVLDYLGNRPLHMSYDIDACDPVIAPSTGTRVRGGLSFREAHYVAEAVAETGRLGSLDMVEINPQLVDQASEGGKQANEDTLDLTLALVGDAFGNRIL
eukprot:m.227834 g.227834  ORF g.227834 m.227834 type:complete len:400 (-) comp11650_c0_seq1:117-1316(-)